jgi:DNA-binding transcriptional ArsR family regulator
VLRIKNTPIDQVELTDIMYALSDPARLEIIKRLKNAGREMTCGELDLDRPKSSMSHHFKILRSAGLVYTEVSGKEHMNSLRLNELEKKFPGVLKSILKLIC